MNQEKIDHAFALYDKGKYSIKEITERTDVSKAKLYKELKNRV
ncbi:helix-turn-helix domain-containing protein [Jeotgalibacillus marinus]|uniref:Helix-turn-helix domain-containing protein n=1 Tax=Jeotgalibacillus marinus TaxID=86667 RepID=A0ABV3Q616_9BACL